ncbi:exopolysaccharide Pel transporter PelG [Vibrio sp. PP-XX7]
MFWYAPYTSLEVLGPMRTSPIYDLPIFLAYLSIIPGMAVFLVRMETDFVEHHHQFYQAVMNDASLDEIYQLKDNMVKTAGRVFMKFLKIQGITLVLLLLWGGDLLGYFGIDVHYRTLLNIDLVGVAIQVVMLSVFNIMYYLDKRMSVLSLNAGFLLCNALFTWGTLQLGPYFYGYGFVLAGLSVTITGLLWLNKHFHSLEYETFMKQKKLIIPMYSFHPISINTLRDILKMFFSHSFHVNGQKHHLFFCHPVR